MTNFVNAIIQAAGTREKAFEETPSAAGWRYRPAGCGRPRSRFNQAFLVSPEQSGVYQGFAVMTQARFKDLDAADELFRIALKQPDPMKALNADYGRLLLIAKRPRDAQPVLEQAVKDAPDFADAWTNLAWARFQNGDPAAACAAAEEAAKQRPSTNSASDLTAVRTARSANSGHYSTILTRLIPTSLPAPRPNLYDLTVTIRGICATQPFNPEPQRP